MAKKLDYNYVKKFFNDEGYILIDDEYQNSNVKMNLICPNGHKCSICFDKFKRNRRCAICRADEKGSRGVKYSLDEIKIALKNLGYDLLSNEYLGEKSKIEVRCVCGNTQLTNLRNIKKSHCSECKKKSQLNKAFEKLDSIGYKLISSEYVSSKSKLDIECDRGHKYKASFDNIIRGNRCPGCNISKGEEAIEAFLIKNKMRYAHQHKFDNCFYKRNLIFDFYIADINLVIEYDGIQHFEPVNYSGKGEEWSIQNIKYIKKKDRIKDTYCKDNDISILRIPYTSFDDIEFILSENLKRNFKNDEPSTTIPKGSRA